MSITIRPAFNAYLDVNYGINGETTYCCNVSIAVGKLDRAATSLSLAELRYLRDKLNAVEAEVTALKAVCKLPHFQNFTNHCTEKVC